MKVLLLEIKGPRSSSIYKDFAGGLGPGFCVGGSWPARLLEKAKHQAIRLPNTSFGYLSAIFARHGHSVVYRVNAPEKADLALIQSSLTDWRGEIETARGLRESGTPVGFLGLFSASRPEAFLAAADFVVRGEPEELMLGIAKGELPIPQGLVESRPLQDLDSLPFPDWRPFPVGSYRYFPSLVRFPVLPILSSRGCAYRCNYCPYIAQYPEWRTRSAENVVDEIDHLLSRFGARGFLFRDPLFSWPMDRAAAIAEGILRRRLSIRFACETRVDCLTPELLELLHRAGLRTVNVGIETTDPEILRRAQRTRIPEDRQRRIIASCHKLGINVTAFYMFGFPGEREEGALRTAAYARELDTLVANFTVFTPFPGIAAESLVAGRIEESDPSLYDSYHLVFRHDHYSAGQLDRLREQAFVSYYFRLGYLARLARSLWNSR